MVSNVTVEVPIKTTNPLNSRVHWRVTQRERKGVRSAVRMALADTMPGVAFRVALPLRITLTRLSVGRLDSDNLQATLKAARDAVQDWLGINDANPELTWQYGQEKTKRGVYGVRVLVETIR